VAVVGGGIVGAAVARELATRCPAGPVVVFEREPQLATGQSGNNSGVIHSGIYYRPGSLKARLCVEGAALLYSYLERQGLPYARCGKVVVAIGWQEVGRLRELARRAAANGVRGARLIDPSELRRIEPSVRGVEALHSPNTGVTDFRALTYSLGRELLEAGGGVCLAVPVLGLAPRPRGVVVRHAFGETFARYAVVCAGAGVERLAHTAGGKREPAIVPFKGTYRELRRPSADLVRALIYPVPDPQLPFLGVHLSRHVDGSVSVGPTALLVPSAGGGGLAQQLAGLGRLAAYPGFWRMARRWWRAGAAELGLALHPAALARRAQRYVPELDPADLGEGFAGVRAQAVGADGSLLDDFAYERLGRILLLRNAPSPAATASLALAREVVAFAGRSFGWRLRG
jgi:L-2-hydroxyglutarate oxidase